MRLSRYLQNLDFNSFRLFYRKNKNFDTFVLDKGDKSEWISVTDEQRLRNSIINDNGQINDSFIEVLNSRAIEKIRLLTDSDAIRIYPNRKYSAYNAALILEKDSKVVGGVDLDLKNRVARTITNSIITLSNEEVESLFEWFDSLGVKLFDYYLPASLTTYGYWMNYEFPFDFFYNAAFGVFETRVNTGLMCVNFVHARLEIEPVEDRVTKAQILRVQSLENKRHQLNEILKEEFWDYYQTQKADFELPELTTKNQLSYFVKTRTIRIPQSEVDPIVIDFATWDKEHGQTVTYYKDQLNFE